MAGAVKAVFPKVLCDRPTFAAKRDFYVPPRVAARDCVVGQRACARRMRQPGRDGCALRCFVAYRGTDIIGRNHAQVGERRADETLVRARARDKDDRRSGEAGGA